MVTAQDALAIYNRLMQNGIPVWVVGGWGIDALLGEQTRPHKDLDALMLLDDMVRIRALLEEIGYTFKYLWEENLPAVDAQGNETDSAFVLGNPGGGEIDIHALRLDEAGDAYPTWKMPEGFHFTKEELGGLGTINGIRVHCITAESQVAHHTGYALPEAHAQDLKLLRERLGVGQPGGEGRA